MQHVFFIYFLLDEDSQGAKYDFEHFKESSDGKWSQVNKPKFESVLDSIRLDRIQKTTETLDHDY